MHLPISLDQLRRKLAEDNLVTADQFEAIRLEAETKGQDIGDILISKRFVDQSYLNSIVTSTLHVELANISPELIKRELLRLLPEETARIRQAIVFDREPDGALSVAMANPGDLETIQFLSQYLKSRIHPYLATPADLNAGFSIYGLQTSDDFKTLINENVKASLRSRTKSAQEAAADLPIVAIVNNLLSFAISSRSSDIHIEIMEDATLVRYRVDGILREIMKLPREIHSALVARFKLLAGLKLDEHFRPQDGRFRYQIVGQVVDIRASVMPTYYGEKIEMRLLDASQRPLSLEELGMSTYVSRVVVSALRRTFGMILATGPTGSGKSTTLYAFINIVNKPSVNIVTIEDPIEYNMARVNQSQVNTEAGISFASGLRAFLRQDPNVIMVGEIRDVETADIAVQAALTGHLLISTLHTNDAPSTIPRLFDLGVPPFLVSSVLNAILAQRLVRKICTSCIYSYEIDASTRNLIAQQLRAANPFSGAAKVPSLLYKGKGCSVCGGSGYRGRMGIYEVIEVNDKVKEAISDHNFNLDRLTSVARQNGMVSMFEDGLEKAEVGLTSLEEVLRVIRE